MFFLGHAMNFFCPSLVGVAIAPLTPMDPPLPLVPIMSRMETWRYRLNQIHLENDGLNGFLHLNSISLSVLITAIFQMNLG